MADDADATLPSVMSGSGSGSGSTAIVPVHNRNDDKVELELSAKASTISLSDALTLTPDLWANIYGYARYEDCLRAFTVCKSFLNDVIPRIKEIAVFDPRALKVGPARLFTGVKSVEICCIFADPPDAPPLPERPANCGYDVTFYGELVIMVGADGDEVFRPLEVDPLVVSASVPFLSAFPSLRNVDFLRYVVDIDDVSDYENAVYDGEPLYTFAIRYFDGYEEPWSKQNDLNMRSLMMSFGGAYSSGLLSTNVIVRRCSLFGYSTNVEGGFCFSSYCASWNAFEEPGEKRKCMCHYISRNFPVEMVAMEFCRGGSGCLPFQECFEIILRRQGGRELLLSPEYILSQCYMYLPVFDDKNDMIVCYAKAGLCPHVTMADIDRYYPEVHDPTWWVNKYRKQDKNNETGNSNDDRSELSDETHGCPSVVENDWYVATDDDEDDEDDEDEDVYQPLYLWRRRNLSESLANFLKALQVAQSSNVEGASV